MPRSSEKHTTQDEERKDYVHIAMYICDCLCEHQPGSHHKLIFFSPACSYVRRIASITLCISCPFFTGLIFSGQLLTVCKCGFDTMAPVERTKWMTHINLGLYLGHGCVYWALRLTKWTALVSVSSLWSFSGQFFQQLLPTIHNYNFYINTNL